MTEHDRELDALVTKFAGDLRALFQKQMRAAFDHIVGGNARPQTAAAAAKPAVAKATKPAPAAAPARAAAAASKGGRRSDAEIAKTVARVKEYVAAHPGSRMEHIGAGLGLATKVLTRPVAKLLASNEIRREGLKRATAYFPGGGVTVAAKPPASAGAKGASKAKPTAKKASGKAGANAAAPS